ncbi:hypothetical protein [Actinomadura oligospora]|nr:hypothetical protein [Actinomadura oligospora]
MGRHGHRPHRRPRRFYQGLHRQAGRTWHAVFAGDTLDLPVQAADYVDVR